MVVLVMVDDVGCWITASRCGIHAKGGDHEVFFEGRCGTLGGFVKEFG